MSAPSAMPCDAVGATRQRGRQGEDEREQPRGAHLHGGHRDRVPALEQLALHDDQRRAEDRRGEHEHVAGRRRGAAGARHQRDPAERDPEARPRGRPAAERPVSTLPAATNTGTAPKMIAACVTLVRSTPRFCSTTIAP